MSNAMNENTKYDTYHIGSKTYVKDTDLGPKAWGKISAGAPGKFIDILEVKLRQLENLPSKVDCNK